jgi:hypothetical protein
MATLRSAVHGGGVVLLTLVVLVLGAGSTRAQPPTPGQVLPGQVEPQIVPGTAAIWTDQSQYQVGQSIQYCYRIPIAGPVTITDILADGTSRPLFNGFSVANTPVCQTGVVTPPVGTECLRLTYPLLGGNGQTQTCFQVVGQMPPPPPPGNLAIYTDRASYRIGDPIQVCYRVPAPGPITIIDMLANGQTQTFLSGYDDGTGGCQGGTVTPPAGVECMTITYTYPNGSQTSAQTCFTVIGVTPPPPPSGWTFLGSANVDASGNWNFTQQTQVAPSLTYVRITNSSCDGSPASNLVWESNLQRLSTSSRVSIWAGELEPVGLASSSGGVGSALLARPVSFNPPTQVDLALFNVGLVYQGTQLNACVRAT